MMLARPPVARRSSWRLGFALLLMLGSLIWTAGCSRRAESPEPGTLRRVTIGIQVSPAMTLAMVAKDAGFFSEQGLDVELTQFTAGKFALQAFLGGSVDFAISGDVPVCLAALQGNQIRVVGQVVDKTTNEVRMVALRDGKSSDSANPEEYFRRRKVKLATSFGGGPEFFTYDFLRHHQIQQDQIELLSQRPEDMPAALETHSVDVISIFDPFAFIAEKRLGNKAVTFTGPDLYSELYVLNARPEQVEKEGATIKSVLRGLIQAEDYVAQNPLQAKQIMQNYTTLDRDVIDGIWGNYSFKVSLNQRLLDYWNEEAIWARETGKVTPQTKVPDFQNYIEKRFLQDLKAGSVRL